jgi:hypothetical protein
MTMLLKGRVGLGQWKIVDEGLRAGDGREREGKSNAKEVRRICSRWVELVVRRGLGWIG